MRANAVVYNARKRYIRFGLPGGLIVRPKGWENCLSKSDKKRINCWKVRSGNAHQVLGSHFTTIATRVRDKKDTETELFAALIFDINKALEIKKVQTPKEIEKKTPATNSRECEVLQ